MLLASGYQYLSQIWKYLFLWACQQGKQNLRFKEKKLLWQHLKLLAASLLTLQHVWTNFEKFKLRIQTYHRYWCCFHTNVPATADRWRGYLTTLKWLLKLWSAHLHERIVKHGSIPASASRNCEKQGKVTVKTLHSLPYSPAAHEHQVAQLLQNLRELLLVAEALKHCSSLSHPSSSTFAGIQNLLLLLPCEGTTL